MLNSNFRCVTRLLIVSLASAEALVCSKDFFARQCEDGNLAETNPHLPQSSRNRSSCTLVVNEDGTYIALPVKIKVVPCRSVEYVLRGSEQYVFQYVKKCGNFVYKQQASFIEGQVDSIIFYSTADETHEPKYIVASVCKRGQLTGRYVEVSKQLSHDDIQALKKIYGIDVNLTEIKDCLAESAEPPSYTPQMWTERAISDSIL